MPVARKLNSTSPRNNLKRVHLLLSDDNHMTGRIEKSSFLEAGFHVKLATTLEDMMEILSKEKIDVAMLDYHSFNGLGIYEIEKAKKHSRNQKIKFIVTSVECFDEIKEKAYSLNSDLFLVKPIPKPKMIEEIKRISQMNYRKSERIKYKLNTTVILKNKKFDTHSIDISADGIHLVDINNKIDPNVGMELEIEFFLPQSENKVKTKGTVVRITEEGFGLKFENISAYNRKIIDRFILQNSLEFRSSHYYL